MISLNKEEALSLASRGLHIFPTNPAKKPLIEDWPNKASSSVLYIEAWWGKWPDALPALPVGAHNLVVIDCDRRPGRPDGVAAFHAICAEQSIDLSDAFRVESPSGGMHYYFATQTPYGNSSGSLPDGIDVRGKGGYVIAPGATLPDGLSYRHVAGSWDAIPALPEALAAFLRSKDVSEVSSLPMQTTVRPAASEREIAYAENALADEVEKLSAMREGEGRNTALNAAALRIGEMVGAGWIERGKVEQALREASVQNGYVAKDGERAANATLQSGLEAGIAKPRDPLSAIQVERQWYEMIARWIEAYKAKSSSLESFIDSIRSPFDYECQPLTYLVNHFIPEAAITMLSGDAGSGKSSLIMKIADAVSKGYAIFGTPVNMPRRVLYLDKDNSLPIVRERLTRLHIKPNPKFFKYWGGHTGVDAPNRIFTNQGLINWVNKDSIKPLIIIDSQIAFQDGRESDSNDIRAFYDPLRRLTYLGATVVVLHHTGKGETTKEFRGSNDIKAAIDAGFTIHNAGGSTALTKLTLKTFKARIAVYDELAFDYVNGEFIPQDLKQAKEDNLIQLLRNNPGITKSEFEKLAMEQKFSRSDIRNYLDKGIGFGTILTRRGERNASLLYLPENVSLAQSWN